MAYQSNDLNYLFIPPETTIDPPVESKNQKLPIDKLSWEDFERLCLALVELDFDISNCDIYGIKGQAQQGIDIFAKKNNGKYSSYQCKRYSDFTEDDVISIVKTFQDGKWASVTEDFYICTSCSLAKTQLQDVFERKKEELKSVNINFIKWDYDTINRLLLLQPGIVYRFFGEQWVMQIINEDELNRLKKGLKLDALSVIKYRKELYKFYSVVFNIYDLGGTIFDDNKSLTLKERFIVPNVNINKDEKISVEENIHINNNRNEYIDKDAANAAIYQNRWNTYDVIKRETVLDLKQQSITINIDEILSINDRNVILGEAGSGKSTLLRFLILDLLDCNPVLTNTVKKWGTCLPVWIPFAFLTKNISKDQNLSVQDILKLWFKSHDNAHLYEVIQDALLDKRLILFIDGLDEWTSLSAANQALAKLEIQANLLTTKIIYSSRPYGFRFLQDLINNVEPLYLSPFTDVQQREFIFKWLNRYYQSNKFHLGEKQEDYAIFQTIAFQKEISNSNELSQLAEYPLLLGILVVQKMRDSLLPKNKISALSEITSYLVTKHPIKRKKQANIVDENISELDDYLEEIFCELALQMQIADSNGVIGKSDAKTIVERVMMEFLGLDKATAKLNSKNLIEIGANSIGIIIERSPEEISFIHRQFLEFLSAKCLRNSDRQPVDSIIEKYCFDPTWHQTIVAFFSLIPHQKQKDFIYYFNIIKNKDYNDVVCVKKILLYELSLNLSNSPLVLINEYFACIVKDFNFESNVDIKRTFLNIIMDAAGNVKTNLQVINFIKSFYPNYFSYRDYRIEYLSKVEFNKLSPTAILFLKYSLINGNTQQKLDASITIQKFIGNSIFIDFIHDICLNQPDIEIRAFALNAILSKELSHSTIVDFGAYFKGSSSRLVQLFYMKFLVFIDKHTVNDLEKLLLLGKQIDFELEDELLNILSTGWGTSPILKKVCIESIAQTQHDLIEIDKSIAWKIIFSCFNKDVDVVKLVCEELQKRHPFLGFHAYGGMDYLQKYFQGNPDIISSVSTWLNEQAHSDPEISFACLIGLTDRDRERLKKELLIASFPHWEIMALLEGWENDGEVIEFLKEYFESNNRNKSTGAYYISKVYKDDKSKGIEIAEEILFDRGCYFRERSLTALIELDKEYFKDNILDKFILEELPHFDVDADFSSYQTALYPIAENFYHLPNVQKLIFRDLQMSINLLDVIIRNELTFTTKVDGILAQSLPLSPQFRYDIVDKISNKPHLSDDVLSILNFELESNDVVKFKSAVRLFEYLKFANPLQLHEIASNLVFARGAKYDINRKIAFAGYLIGKRLTDYFSLVEDQTGRKASPNLQLDYIHHDVNIDQINLLLDNFNYIYDELNGNFVQLSGDQNTTKNEQYWAFWAKYSNSSSQPTKYLMEYIENNSNRCREIVFLEFLDRVAPKSTVLKNIALDIVNFHFYPSTQHEVDTQVLAGKILGLNFNSDYSIKEMLVRMSVDSYLFSVGRVVALCTGWPEEQILKDAHRYLVESERPVIKVIGYHLKFLVRNVHNIIDFIISLTRENNEVINDYSSFYSPLLRRIHYDSKLVEEMQEMLVSTSDFRVKILLYSLLKKTGRITESILKWKTNEMARLNNQQDGYDIVTNRTVSWARLIVG